MPPLIDQLIEHARIGMLGRDAQADQLHAHAGDFLHQTGNIVEPPAAEHVEIPELSGQHAQLGLVLPRQGRDEKPIFPKSRAEMLDGAELAQADAVPGQHIGLLPGGGPQGQTGPVAYWHVDDIEGSSPR